jgi:D-alanyl-D-alanine carboxypeptidase
MDQLATVTAPLRDAKVPGIQYVAVHANGTLLEYHGGFADLAARRRMLAATPMMAYSMSKTVTAAAVLQLVEGGRLGLDDSLARHVDAQPYGPQVTVRQLLSHTAGVPNPLPLKWVHRASAHAAFDERAALARVLRDHPKLASAPGAKYAYSNIGYWLLGAVVEHASGTPFTRYVAERILRPLGVQDELGYAAAGATAVASGYLEKYSLINAIKGWLIDRELVGRYSGPWLHIREHYLNGPAFGGLVGSADSFGRFLQDQLRERSSVLGDVAKRLFYEQQRTRDGRIIAMTLGWHVGARGRQRVYFKEGGGGGFHSLMRLYPERGIGTVVIANATRIHVHALLDRMDSRLPHVALA